MKKNFKVVARPGVGVICLDLNKDLVYGDIMLVTVYRGVMTFTHYWKFKAIGQEEYEIGDR